MAAPASDLLRHFPLLLWNCWTELNKTLQEARFQHPLPSLCFSGRSKKQDGRPGPGLGWEVFDFSSETFEGNSMKLDGKQDLNVFSHVCVFRADCKTRWLSLPLIGWDIFDFLLKPPDRIQRNLTGTMISTSSTKFVFFGPIGKTRWPP